MASCLILGNIKFGALDDYFMAAVLSGAHGTDYNPHMYFVNAIYGYALLPFYHLFPKIGWYYIGELISVFLSFTTTSYILINKLEKKWGILAIVALLTFTGKQFYLDIQFTQCAALLSAAGALSILWGISEQKKKIIILGGILFFWGALMRWDAFLMGLPFIAVSMLVQLKDCWLHKKSIIITTLILLATISTTHYFNKNLYDTPEYKPYKDIQGPRAAFGDGNDYNKRATYEDLEEAGKSGEDYDMLVSWKFYDPEVFAVDSLKEIWSYALRYKNSISQLPSPYEILGNLSNSIHHNTCLIFFVLGILILLSNSKRGAYPWFALLTTMALITYLIHINRVVVRVENGFWMYASLLAIPHLAKIKTIPTKIVTIAVGILLSFNFYNLYQIEPIPKKQELYNKVFEYIDSKPNTIFLLSMPQYAMFANHKLPPYYAEPIGGFRRTISFGYWTPYLPEITATLKEFGVTNPFKDMVHDNVEVVGDGNFKEYLERHYYKEVAVDTINKIGNVNFFKYSIVEDK